MNKTIFTDKTYLSEVMEYLPSGVLLNKGITGCGGTYVELNSKRDSLILVPTIELAKNKEQPNSLIVYGKVTKKQIEEYIYSDIKYKKIIGTYDSLLRMIDFPEITNYFLLIDEYHVLFNSYAFRNKAILNILKTYKLFKDFCFMTATPLNDDIILNEIKDLPKIDIVWEKAIPVKLNVVDVNFTTKELLKIISKKEDVNYHIFLNSVKTIKEIIPKLDEYKVVCSQEKIRSLEVSSTKDPVKRFNFYTSAAFEGCDINDPKGKTIILCDTKIATTILDISTLVRQICGRLRDSIYKDEVTLILNTGRHRYAGKNKETFKKEVEKNVLLGRYTELLFNSSDNPLHKEAELRKYQDDTFHSMYINKYQNEIFYDDNLRKMDEYNFELITEIYDSSISVMKSADANNFISKEIKQSESNWIVGLLKNKEYSFNELYEIFFPLFEERGLTFTAKSLKDYFPEFTKRRKSVNKIRETYYRFKN